MNRKTMKYVLAGLLTAGSGTVLACEYKAGETLFLDYANCRYGEDSVLVIDLGKDTSWEKCYYYAEPFRPEKLLAVTKQKDGKEVLSINDRAQIGNPCYLTKRNCDAALKAYKSGSY
jgi:hypothetical protein